MKKTSETLFNENPNPDFPGGLANCASEKDLLVSLRAVLNSNSLGPGFRLPSIRRLAAASGLRQHEVSRAINVLALEGMVEVRQGSGTYVSGSNGTAKTRPGENRRISVVPPNWDPGASHHGVAGILSGISAECGLRHTLELVHLSTIETSPDQFVEGFRSSNIDGMIWIQPPAVLSLPMLKALNAGVPVVLTGRSYRGMNVPSVVANADAVGESVAKLMKRHNRKKLICMVGGREDAYTESHISAIRVALAEHDLTLPDENIVTVHLSGFQGFYSIELADGVRRFLNNNPDFDAVYSLYPDHTSILNELHKSGKRCCPRDFIHIHYGQHNTWSEQEWPKFPVAFLEVPYKAIGQQAVRLLEDTWGLGANGPATDLRPYVKNDPYPDSV